MTTCDKTNVWQNLENMRKLGTAVNSFYSVLGKKLEESFTKGKPIDVEEEELTEGDWCCFATCWVYTLKITKPNGSKQACPLSVRTELWREINNDKSDWEHAKSPLIYIGFDPDLPKKGNAWGNDYLKLNEWGQPVHNDEDCEIVEPAPNKNPYLWEWPSEDKANKSENSWSERSWFFVVPLFDINSTNDIQEQILDPLKSLLVDNKSPEDAFRDSKAIKNT